MFYSFKFTSFSLFAALTFFGGSACTLLAPGESKDGVVRCGSEVECGDNGLNPDDNRYAYVCARADEQEDDESPGVCEPAFRSVECGFSPMESGEYQGLGSILTQINSSIGNYDVKCEKGAIGCEPAGDSCNDGGRVVKLEGPNNKEISVCAPSDEKARFGVEYSYLRTSHGDKPEETQGLDLRSQFCAWYFCDDDFVCDTSLGDQGQWSCIKCDPDASPDNGGCAQVNVGGKPSTVYKAVASSCNKGEASIKDEAADNMGPIPAAK